MLIDFFRRLYATIAELIGLGRYQIVVYDRQYKVTNRRAEIYGNEAVAASVIAREQRKGLFTEYQDVMVYNQLTHDRIQYIRGTEPQLDKWSIAVAPSALSDLEEWLTKQANLRQRMYGI